MTASEGKKRFDVVTKNDVVKLIKEKDNRLQDYVIKLILDLEHDVYVDTLKAGKEIRIKDHLIIYPFVQKAHNGVDPYRQVGKFIPSKVVAKAELGKELKEAAKDLDVDKIKNMKK